jgi:predicted DCC family thiol-disulfide oxidoreductase YuxK
MKTNPSSTVDRGSPASPQPADAGPCHGTTVFFDGSCPLCRREIAVYRARLEGGPVAFTDVSAVTGPRVAADLSRQDAMARFHVRAADGRLLSGAAAFAYLWRETPGFRTLGRLAALPVVLPLLEMGYRGTLVIRPWLQRQVRRWEKTPPAG